MCIINTSHLRRIEDMASITSQIKNFILLHQSGEPISSVSLLKFGRRNTIDKITSVLTKEGFLKRVTRGMFVRGDSDTIPGDEEIARAKADVFHKQVETSSFKSRTFFTTGCKSSYQTIHGRHVMKTMSAKRLLKQQLQNKLDKEKQHHKAQSYNGNRKSVSKVNVQRTFMKLIGSNQAKTNEQTIQQMLENCEFNSPDVCDSSATHFLKQK